MTLSKATSDGVDCSRNGYIIVSYPTIIMYMSMVKVTLKLSVSTFLWLLSKVWANEI